MNNLEDLVCPHCGGHCTAIEFRHNQGCIYPLNIVNNAESNEQRTIELLESIDKMLSKIYREVESIRLRIR